MHPIEIKKLIEKKLLGSIVEVNGDDGSHFSAIVVSELFVGKSKVSQQQMVYGALGEHITNGDIHAISLKTYTPDEWSAR